ncbi:MAG: multiprotein bridging factor aMBF1 [Promethearchaeota archaeon]
MRETDCEICGGVIWGKAVKIRVEGTTMNVCGNCSDLGEKIYNKPRNNRIIEGWGQRSSTSRQPIRPVKPSSRPRTARKRRTSIDSYEIVDKYDEIIRKARGTMTQEEFADTINEKVALIHQIETRKMKPTIKLAKKIEKTYHVKLIEKIDESEDIDDISWKRDKKDSFVPTLGDFIKKRE